MPDTVIRYNNPAFAGKTLHLRIENAAGLIYNGTSLVTFVLANLATYYRSFPESPVGSGRFSLDFAPLDLPADDYDWVATMDVVVNTPAITDPLVYSDGDHWDGTQFTGSASGSDTLAGMTATGIVSSSDPAPTSKTFVVQLAGNAAVPAQPNWRGRLFGFTSGQLAQAKATVTAYRQLSSTTALVTVGEAFPVAPAAGDAWVIL